MRVASVAMASVLVATPGVAQGSPADLCGACKTTGKIENPWFVEHGNEEVGCKGCSTFFEGDPAGCGAPFLPCARCRRADLKAAAERELATLKKEREAWLAGQRAVDARLGTKLTWVESDHFVIGFEPAHYKTRDKRDLDAHAAAHRFARRLEGMYADFERLFGIDDVRMRNRRHQVLIFERLKTMSKASEVLLSMTSGTAAKLAGDPSILVTWVDKSSLPGDLAMDRHVTHHVTHLLCSVFHLKEWLYSQGFLDEGIAHYFEMRYFGAADNSCNQEEEEEDFGNEDWTKAVLLAVQQGKHPSLAELCAKRTDQLRGSDHSFAWSLADFLIAESPAKTAELMVKLKEKVELREALRIAFGQNFFGLEKAWRSFVLAEYPGRIKARPPVASVRVPGDALRGEPEKPPATSSSSTGEGRR